MTVPCNLTRYQCEDYFQSEFAKRGYWDEESQLQVVVPATEVREMPEQEFLVVGRAGVDGILFGYRVEQPGLWAFYPIDREFVKVANSVGELVECWISGITL